MKSAIVALLAGALACAIPAAAQQPEPAQTVVYTLRMSGQGPQMSGPPGGMQMKMTITIKSTDSDGTRHATVKLEMPQAPQMKPPPIDATISPAGAIALAHDMSNVKPSISMSKAQAQAAGASAQAAMLQFTLRPFNAFAAACAAETAMRPGYSWHSTTQEPPPMDIVYTMTGREQHLGHDTAVVTMQSAPGSTGMGTVSGRGYYAPAEHLVVDMHSELKSPDNKQSQIVDIALTNP